MKTPEQHFKELKAELQANENGDEFYTGNVEEALSLLKEWGEIDGYEEVQLNPHYVLYSNCGSYWGSGTTLEEAKRYLAGAVLSS